ncbi:uncharacterized protein [Ptychodera flava]|uniref:uncharacterized protein n=1 Tax=Ptychodera flava TaxID=63121 RepID=UPI00396A5E21
MNIHNDSKKKPITTLERGHVTAYESSGVERNFGKEPGTTLHRKSNSRGFGRTSPRAAMGRLKNGTSVEDNKRRDELTQKFVKLRMDAEKKGLDKGRIKEIFLASERQTTKTQTENSETCKTDLTEGAPTVSGLRHFASVGARCATWPLRQFKSIYVLSFLIPVIVGILMLAHRADYQLQTLLNDIREMPCLVDTNFVVMEMTRPVVDCEMCRGLESAPVLQNLSQNDFVEKYAYSGVPALITGATTNWTAMKTFSFHFFQQLYTQTEGALQNVEDECQFFPYNTEFSTLAEALNMSDERASFQKNEKTWYIGWSNCHPDIASVLREHYQRPYFLPDDSESSSLDWIFMGGSGIGANIHLDFVQRPSWQAQISGQKTWTLIPPPECEDVCKPLEITVSKGDIIVIDTNIWYHATRISPGEISITIGSEYD